MNRLEKFIYDCVKSSPVVKFALRNIYQSFYDMMPTPKNFSESEISYKEDYFFGFHDKSPFSADGTRLLANHTLIPLRMPLKDESLEVGFFDLSADGKLQSYHVLGKSYAWNYHKGSRLQYVDQNHVIYNTRENDELISKIVSLNGETIRCIPCAIDTVSEDGLWATSFSYERLHELMPGYGYDYCHDGGFLDNPEPEETGLFLVNLKDGHKEMLYSLKALASRVKQNDGVTYRHYVTHTEFSKTGRYISFLHRWIGHDSRKRHTELVVYDRNTGTDYVLPTTGMVSHYVWNAKDQIVAYCSVKEGDAHVLFDIVSRTYRPILLNKLNSDGHQSMVGDECFVTDTYPDKYRMASLYFVDMVVGSCRKIAYLYSPKRFQTKDFHKHIACDLHPRMSPSGQFVCFDSVYTGKRSICVMPLKQF